MNGCLWLIVAYKGMKFHEDISSFFLVIAQVFRKSDENQLRKRWEKQNYNK